MLKKKPAKKAAKSVKKTSKPAKKPAPKTRSSSKVTKTKDGSQFKLVSIYIILGIIFLGYIFYHSQQNKQPTTVNDMPTSEISK